MNKTYRHDMIILFLNIIKQDTRLWHPYHEMAVVFYNLLLESLNEWLSVKTVK